MEATLSKAQPRKWPLEACEHKSDPALQLQQQREQEAANQTTTQVQNEQ